jgi:hypothetical protein
MSWDSRETKDNIQISLPRFGGHPSARAQLVLEKGFSQSWHHYGIALPGAWEPWARPGVGAWSLCLHLLSGLQYG